VNGRQENGGGEENAKASQEGSGELILKPAGNNRSAGGDEPVPLGKQQQDYTLPKFCQESDKRLKEGKPPEEKKKKPLKNPSETLAPHVQAGKKSKEEGPVRCEPKYF